MTHMIGRAPTRRVPRPYLLTTAPKLGESAATWPTHTHEEHLLVWSERGATRVHSEGRHWIVPPGLGLWIPAGTAHEVSSEPGVRYACTYFAPETCTLPWTEIETLGVNGALRALLLHMADTNMPTEDRLRAQRVSMDLLQNAGIANVSAPDPTDPRLHPLTSAILADPSDERSLEQWARELNLSVRTLARAFAEDVEMSFTQWRLLVRMRAAIDLLAAGLPTGVVAGRVGYGTVSAFGAAFRRVTGQSPGSYLTRARLAADAGHPRHSAAS